MRKVFRNLLAGAEIIVTPGAYDAFSGRLIEEAGFKAAMIGGGPLNAVIGHANGGSTMTEYLSHVKEIADALSIPVVVDIEGGFGTGTALDLMRTIRECERLGVAAVHCEDQANSVKVSSSGVPEILPRTEMLKKIEAALEAREDKDFVFIARTDARMRYGLAEALERGRAYAQAGADMVLVSSLESADELKRAVDTVGAPLMVYAITTNPGDDGAVSWSLSTGELQEIGVRLVAFGNGLLRTSGQAIRELLAEIRRTGTERGFVDRMLGRKDVSALVGAPARDALRKRFLGGTS